MQLCNQTPIPLITIVCGTFGRPSWKVGALMDGIKAFWIRPFSNHGAAVFRVSTVVRTLIPRISNPPL
jgi:hypothetical protein